MKRISHIVKIFIWFLIFCIVVALILSWLENVEFGESLYRTFLLMATVSEYPATNALGRVIAIIAMFFGLGIILYLVSVVAGIIVRIDMQKVLNLNRSVKKRKNQKRIK
jgi:hypothetical protein